MKKTRDLTLSAIFVALIAISAQITIPLPYVPFTLQLFTITLAAYLLSKRQITLTLIVYMILGFLGLPIFANYSSGILKPTAGFILGFMPFAHLLKKSNTLALLSLYTIGLLWLSLYFYYVLDLNIKIFKIITSYGLIFLPTDYISITLAKIVSKRRFF